jgi:7-carboxy-7-deazaguanine synthase
MKKLVLSEDGIFPITKDKNGNLLETKPSTGLSVAGTIQGEGKLAGTPSLFIRFAGCNLCCAWELPDKNICTCDSNHTINPHPLWGVALGVVSSSLANIQISISDAIKTIKHNIGTLNHIVITGGEPLLQRKTLTQLVNALKDEFKAHLTLETNGTLFDLNIARQVDLISISPKLKNSNPTLQKMQTEETKLPIIVEDHEEFEDSAGNAARVDRADVPKVDNMRKADRVFESHAQKRVNIEILQSFIDTANDYCKEIQFKFVVASAKDEYEIKEEFLSKLSKLDKADILVMPLGSTVKELEQTSPAAFEIAVKNGWRFSPRLQINLFDNRAKV